MMHYIDANIFIFAALSNDVKGKKAQDIIKKIIVGEISAVTSSLTIDEVVWKILKETKDRDIAIEQGLRIMQFDNLKIVGVNEDSIQTALRLMQKYSTLKPRDAIHLSVALNANASVIITDDSDFNVIAEIKRKSLD